MYDTILWATDASPIADGALAEALRLLQAGGRLIAFHCDERFPPGRVGGIPLTPDEPERIARLQEQVAELQSSGIDARLVVEVSRQQPVAAIARAAEECGADAIVCGTRGFGIVAGAIAGSVAMRLPHVTACPVVVVSERAARHAGYATA
jgi:nucleotide-binding universal stress UspA family protein